MLRKTVQYVFRWSFGLGLVFMGLYWIGGMPMLRLLTDDEGVVGACRQFLPWLVLMPPVGCAAFAWDGIYIGATAAKSIRNAMFGAFLSFLAVWLAGRALLLHGTADQAVAYKHLGALGKGIWGSDYLVKHWARQGFTNYCIYRFKGRQHEVAAYMNYVWEVEKEFLEQNVILGRARTVDTIIDDPSLPVWPWARASLDKMYGK